MNKYKTPSPNPTAAFIECSTKKDNEVKTILYLRDISARHLDIADELNIHYSSFSKDLKRKLSHLQKVSLSSLNHCTIIVPFNLSASSQMTSTAKTLDPISSTSYVHRSNETVCKRLAKELYQ